MFFKLLSGDILNVNNVQLFVPWKVDDFFQGDALSVDTQIEDIFSVDEVAELKAVGAKYPGIIDSVTIAAEAVLNSGESVFLRCDEWQQLKGLIESKVNQSFWAAENKMLSMLKAYK